MNVGTACAAATGLILALTPGCAVQRLRVNAFLSHELRFPEAGRKPAPVIAVVVGSEPKEPLLEAEVARKVKHLLRERGYQPGSEEHAEYVLTCWISIDEGNTECVSDYGYRYPRVATSFVYTHHGQWHSFGLHLPDVAYGGGAGGYSYTYYTRFLGLTLYERQRWAAASEDEVGAAAVWTCTAVSTGSSSDLRTAVNYLLAAGFDRFGEDTGREVRVCIDRNDPRVAAIIEAGTSDDTVPTPPNDNPRAKQY